MHTHTHIHWQKEHKQLLYCVHYAVTQYTHVICSMLLRNSVEILALWNIAERKAERKGVEERWRTKMFICMKGAQIIMVWVRNTSFASVCVRVCSEELFWRAYFVLIWILPWAFFGIWIIRPLSVPAHTYTRELRHSRFPRAILSLLLLPILLVSFLLRQSSKMRAI